MRLARRWVAVGAVAGVVLGGCGAAGRRMPADGLAGARGPDVAAEEAERVAELAPYLTRVHGRCETGAVASRFVAYFDGEEVRYLIERTEPASPTSAVWVSEYFFENGRLFHFRGNWRAEAGGGGPEGTRAGDLRLSFDGSGLLVRGSKTVDGFPAVVEDDEVAGVQRRAGHLRPAALEAYWRQRLGVLR